jgi:predicted nucleic acid-binding Zn ribbon protein/prefoldin subunit 5
MRVLSRGKTVYDEKFHQGVNIIRGQNGSGKSTISDFIFFILGGEFSDWKDAATRCDEVQAEVKTSNGVMTLRRHTDSKTSPVYIFFGSFAEAEGYALEGWQRFPIRRQENSESFSQVLFRSMNIPEAKSDGASNITMHQLLRLCYSDQRTPPPRLFRFEPFDTQNIREAIGDLICGISGYELYESHLKQRKLEKDLSEVSSKLSGLLRALPPDDALRSADSIKIALNDLDAEKNELESAIRRLDEDSLEDVSEHIKSRRDDHSLITKQTQKLKILEDKILNIELEIKDILSFDLYLMDLLKKLQLAETSSDILGAIEFTHCPSCGAVISNVSESSCCSLCKENKSSEQDNSRYNLIRLDIEMQLRESKQLMRHKDSELKSLKVEYKITSSSYSSSVSSFAMKYSASIGPREKYLTEKSLRIGQINAEIVYLTRSLVTASEVDDLSEQKSSLQQNLDKLKDKISMLNRAVNKRRKAALKEISDNAVALLHADCKRQEEFENAREVKLNFTDDAVFVDGQMNFAESSNVFLKNSAILSLFLSAGANKQFYHPRFLLLDNIEDKGMEVERTHLFQRLIVEKATELEIPYQVIFTTSMMNPELELDDYVIGPSYTREKRSLDFNQTSLS